MQLRSKLLVETLRRPLIGVLFVAATACNVAYADPATGIQADDGRPAGSQVALEREANTLRSSSEPTPDAAPTSEFNQLLQDLSPLPVLALGLLGLFWIRRHTTEL